MKIERKRAFIIRFLYVLICLGTGYVLIKKVLPMVSPFLLAFLIAYLLKRPIMFISNKGKVSWRVSAVLVVSAFYGLLGTLIGLGGVKALAGIGTIVRNLPELYATYLEPELTALLETLKHLLLQADTSLIVGLERMSEQLLRGVGEMVSQVSVWAVGVMSGMVVSLPELFLKLMLMIISTFFIALDYEKIQTFWMDRIGEKPKVLFLKVKDYLTGTLFVCIRSYLLIMLITFSELVVGLSFIGMEHVVLLAGIIAVYDILPVLGTGGIILPWAGISLFQGEYDLAIQLLILYLTITVIRNIIEPKLVGTQLGMHPVMMLISMYAGVYVFGVSGLYVGPILFSLRQFTRDNHFKCWEKECCCDRRL